MNELVEAKILEEDPDNREKIRITPKGEEWALMLQMFLVSEQRVHARAARNN